MPYMIISNETTAANVSKGAENPFIPDHKTHTHTHIALARYFRYFAFYCLFVCLLACCLALAHWRACADFSQQSLF